MVVGVIVAVIWGGVLLASIVPHNGVSWQAHVCGGIAGVLIAWRLAEYDRRQRPRGVQVGFRPNPMVRP
jgi:membrane associated rhomboid family serine protease